MKKYFLMLLAAMTLAIGFTACSKDNEEENKQQGGGGGDEPVVLAEYDYSATLGMTVQQMLATFGEPNPDMTFGTFYTYTYEKQKIETLSFVVNPDNQKIYYAMAILTEGAYKQEDLKAYFDSNYKYYGKEEYPGDEEEGIEASTIYTYGNTAKKEDATLVIELTNARSISFTNPKNEPADNPDEDVFAEITPIQVLGFLGEPWADIEEDYGEAFTATGNYQMATCPDNPYLTGFALVLNEEGVVSSITFFFNIEGEELFNYFTGEGWTVIDTGEKDDEDEPIYRISKNGIVIMYSGEMGTAVIEG